MALIEKLSAIGAAIREKNGTEELLTLDQMVVAISEIKGGGEGIVYTNIDSNDDGSFSLGDIEGNKHMLIPTIDENGTITAIDFDGETIELTYDDNGALIAIGDTITDFSNVIVDEEAAAEEDYIGIRFLTGFISNGTTSSSFYHKDYPNNDTLPMSRATGGTLKLDCELEGTKPTNIQFHVYLATYKEDGSSITPIKILSYTTGTTMSTGGVQEISFDLSRINSSAVNGRIYVSIAGSASGNAKGNLKISNVRIEPTA